MRERARSGTGLFMTELILVILFFSIAAACCLQVFARAEGLHRQSQRLKQALNSTENLVQQLRSLEGEPERLAEYYPHMRAGEETVIFFDQDGQSCGEEQADYRICLTVFEEEGITWALLESRNGKGEEVYTLKAPLFPNRTGGEWR